MEKRNEELDKMLDGLLHGNPNYDTFMDPREIIEFVRQFGASIEQIEELKDILLNRSYYREPKILVDQPDFAEFLDRKKTIAFAKKHGIPVKKIMELKEVDEFELRCAMSEIPGYYGEFLEKDNEEFRVEYFKDAYGQGAYEAKYDKLIDIASKQGISYHQSANLGANYSGSDIGQPKLSFLSHDKRFPEWMVKLAKTPGCDPKEILRLVRIDNYIRRDVKIATAIALIKEFPEVAMEAVQSHANVSGPEDEAFDEYDEDKYESFMDEMLESELANIDGKPILTAREVASTITNYGIIDFNVLRLIKCAKQDPETILNITNAIVNNCCYVSLIDYICEMYKECQELGCLDGLFKALKKQMDSEIKRLKNPSETDEDSLDYYLKDINYKKNQLRRILNIPGLAGEYKSCIDDLLVGLDQCEERINGMKQE